MAKKKKKTAAKSTRKTKAEDGHLNEIVRTDLQQALQYTKKSRMSRVSDRTTSSEFD